jgi:tRNA nucleotidyltransferase (CCA-adding enzyme)
MQQKKDTVCWEHFPHQADMGIRGFGSTMEEAFEQAALALTAVITQPDKVEPVEEVQISCREEDSELLFVDWLNSLLYEMAVRKMLFSEFEVHIEQGSLTATVWGQRLDSKRHRPAVEVKAATYTALKVTQEQDRTWVAQCVVDV